MIDPKINVSPELGKQIAQIICKEIKDSFGGNDKRYKLAKRCENQYNQMTKWDVAGKECDTPWKGASNYFIGLSEWMVDAIWSRLMNILFSQQPFMKAKGVESSDMGKQDAVTDFIDMVLREKVKLYDNINFFFKQMIKLPFAVVKYCWVQDYDRMISKEQAMTFTNPQTGEQQMLLPDDPEIQIKQAEFITNGYQPGPPQEVWVVQDEELVNAPQLQYIRFEDYVYSPFAKRGQRLFWEGDRFWLTINEMIMKSNQEKYIQDSVDKVRINRKDAQKSGVDAIVSERETPIECFHWYGRFPFNKNNEIDFNDPEAIEQEVVCDVSYKEEELLEINHWYYRRKPWPDRVYLRGEYEETEDFEGRSLLMKLFKSQIEVNDFHKTLMDNALLAMQKIFVKKSTLTGEAWENPIVAPGEMWEEDNPGDVRVLEVGDVKAIGLQMDNMIIGFAERLSNITSWNVGSQPPGGKTTATEFAGIIHEGNIGREPLLQRCYRILTKICQWTYDYYYENMPEGLERRILGETEEEIYPTQENMVLYAKQGINPTWRQEDIAGQFDYTWQGTSQNADQKWNIMVANDLMDRYLPHPMIQGSLLYTWNILKDGLIARGHKDWQNYIPTKQAIIAEMKRMALQAQQQEVTDTTEEGVLGNKGKQIDPRMLMALKQKISQQGALNVGQPV
jgi:hypothetical protein